MSSSALFFMICSFTKLLIRSLWILVKISSSFCDATVTISITNKYIIKVMRGFITGLLTVKRLTKELITSLPKYMTSKGSKDNIISKTSRKVKSTFEERQHIIKLKMKLLNTDCILVFIGCFVLFIGLLIRYLLDSKVLIIY